MWIERILDDVKIAYATGYTLRSASLTPENVAAHRDDYLGIFLPKEGYIIYPQIEKKSWGSQSAKFSNNVDGTSLTELQSGKALTIAAYNADAANRGNDCAIGYAHNFERFINGKGIGKGDWFIGSPSDFSRIFFSNYAKIHYAFSLYGVNLSSKEFWTSADNLAQNAYRFNVPEGNFSGASKNNTNFYVLLMAHATISLAQQS